MSKLLDKIKKTLKIGPYSEKAKAQREEEQRRERAKKERQKAKSLAQDSEDAMRVESLMGLLYPESELELKNVDVGNIVKMFDRTVYHHPIWQYLGAHVLMLRSGIIPMAMKLKAQSGYQKQALELVEQIRTSSEQKKILVQAVNTGACAKLSEQIYAQLTAGKYIHPKFYEPIEQGPKEPYTPRKVGALH